MRTLGVLLSVALTAGGSLVGGCHEPPPPKESRVLVEVGTPWQRDVDVTLRYPVELQADETVAITPVAISGFLRRVLVDVGDEVKGGQLIALVDCREYKAQSTQAETVIAKRVAQAEESKSQLERLERMGESMVAPAELERAAAEARVAEAELADARAKASEAGQRQGYCSLTAPFGGYVSERFLDAGAMVSPGGRPVVNIVKTRAVRVVASIIEADAPKITRGVDVDVVLNAFPDTPFRAEVARVGRALDPATRTLRVEMDIPNKTALLLPGMTGRASIVVDTRKDALLVPITAVLQLEEAAYAYVVDEQDGQQVARRVEVELGVDLGDWVEVRKGLEPTDRVIMVGRELVGEGTELEIADSTQEPPAEPPEPSVPLDSDGADATEGETDTEAREPEKKPGKKSGKKNGKKSGKKKHAKGSESAGGGDAGVESAEGAGAAENKPSDGKDPPDEGKASPEPTATASAGGAASPPSPEGPGPR